MINISCIRISFLAIVSIAAAAVFLSSMNLHLNLSFKFQESTTIQPIMQNASSSICQVFYTAVIPSHSENRYVLRKTVESITSQRNLPPFEIIVIRDGYEHIEEFMAFAKDYSSNHTVNVHTVDTSLLLGSSFSQMVLNPKHQRCNVVRFVTKTNFGPAAARNFGFLLSSGVWIHPIDGDDSLGPGFFENMDKELEEKFKVSFKSASSKVNIIMPTLAIADGTVASWQAGGDLDDLPFRNVFHCCGLILRDIVTSSGVYMNSFMSVGWEDWDFWIKLHRHVHLKPLYLKTPLYIYSSWSAAPTTRITVSSFCSTHEDLCRSLLYLSNLPVFSWFIVRQSLRTLMSQTSGKYNVQEVGGRYYDRINALADASVPEALIFKGIRLQLSGSNELAASLYSQVFKLACENNNILEMRTATWLASRLSKTELECHPTNCYLTTKVHDLAFESHEFAKNAVYGNCAILYSAILSLQDESEYSLRQSIYSILKQSVWVAIPRFEILIVSGGDRRQMLMLERVHQYFIDHPIGGMYPPRLWKMDQPRTRNICPSGRQLSFVLAEGQGAAAARNIGISLASGMWIHPIAASVLLPCDFMAAVSQGFASRKKHLGDPGNINAISVGVPVDLLKLRHLNIFLRDGHQVLFLRSMWDEGIHYNALFDSGFENWDFWLNMHFKFTLQLLQIRRTDISSAASEYAGLCEKYEQLCREVFVFVNHEKYEWATVHKSIQELKKLFKKLSVDTFTAWFADDSSPETKLLATRFKRNATLVYEEIFMQNCFRMKSKSISHIAKYLLRSKFIVCNDSRAQDNGVIPYKSLVTFLDANRNSDPFHMMLTSYPTNPMWLKLMHHAISGVLVFNPDSILVIHTPLENAKTVFHSGFLEHFSGRLVLAEIADVELTDGTDARVVLDFMKREAAGRPLYYSHYTDFYRFLIIYLHGGTYLDMDIVLRDSLGSLNNTLCPQSQDYYNGAFLKFEKLHPFIRSCLFSIPKVYDPYSWGTIGPDLITTISLGTQGSYKPLHQSAFYAVPWDQAQNLLKDGLSEKDYNERDPIAPHYGYHFWSRILFRDDGQVFHKHSLGGWALSRTCLLDIMDCKWRGPYRSMDSSNVPNFVRIGKCRAIS